ncbi:MAG: hypothetical protein L6Q37_04420 [Bdellovibrionaceae bacterium]|nr:hypothetical protein [Pseudobdellovibrionaceae bacterium]NUM57041.1 hypothetical protein [Pseudobdellovibrionaceae bacterium]
MDGLQKIISSKKEGFEGFSARDIVDISSLIYLGSIGEIGENSPEIFFFLMDVNKKAQKTIYDKGSGIINPIVLLNFLSAKEVLLIPQLVEYFKVLIDDRIQEVKNSNELLLLEEPKIGFFDRFFSREKKIQAHLKLKKYKQVNLYLGYLQQSKVFIEKSLTSDNHFNAELSLLTENLALFNAAKVNHSNYSFELSIAAKEQEFEQREWQIKWNSQAGKWSLNIDFKNGKFFSRQSL